LHILRITFGFITKSISVTEHVRLSRGNVTLFVLLDKALSKPEGVGDWRTLEQTLI